MTFELHWSNGRVDTFDTLDEAEAAVLARHPDADMEHDGDLRDGGDRTLCWRCEDEAVDDDGARAVASIWRGR